MKKIILCLFFVLSYQASYANTMHQHPQFNSSKTVKTQKSIKYPGRCEIEILNNSYEAVNVYGEFDDGAWLSFNIYPYSAPHRISLFYYGYCHADMYVHIETLDGYLVFTGFPSVGSTIEVTSFYSKNLKANLSQK